MNDAPGAAPETATAVPISPCVGICLMDPKRRLCRGCWRTIDEIAGWYSASTQEKRATLARIAERRATSEGIR